jgi:hypothetical protein
MKEIAMKYLERLVLEQLSKSDLITKVIELQHRDKEWFDKYSNLYKSKKESEVNFKKTLKLHEARYEELFKSYSLNQSVAEEYKRVADLKLGNSFDINASWIDKIVFVLKEANRPLRSAEIIEVLLKNDITFRTITNKQKGLSTHLTKALKYGRIIGTKQKGQNAYVFSLPE